MSYLVNSIIYYVLHDTTATLTGKRTSMYSFLSTNLFSKEIIRLFSRIPARSLIDNSVTNNINLLIWLRFLRHAPTPTQCPSNPLCWVLLKSISGRIQFQCIAALLLTSTETSINNASNNYLKSINTNYSLLTAIMSYLP